MVEDHHNISLEEALVQIQSTDEAHRFLLDICTPAEMRALSERWTVCQLLHRGGYSYRQISNMTGTSLTTIVRVARFLNDEPHGGYRSLLEKLDRDKDKGEKDEQKIRIWTV